MMVPEMMLWCKPNTAVMEVIDFATFFDNRKCELVDTKATLVDVSQYDDSESGALVPAKHYIHGNR